MVLFIYLLPRQVSYEQSALHTLIKNAAEWTKDSVRDVQISVLLVEQNNLMQRRHFCDVAKKKKLLTQPIFQLNQQNVYLNIPARGFRWFNCKKNGFLSVYVRSDTQMEEK